MEQTASMITSDGEALRQAGGGMDWALAIVIVVLFIWMVTGFTSLWRDRFIDVGRGYTIRTFGMAAMEIRLGIPGFFTGGSAWAVWHWPPGALQSAVLIYIMS